MITIFSSAHWSISRGGSSIPSGMSMCPSDRPMLTFLRIERPTSATLRPFFSAACTTCWTRWMFDAKQVTTMRPSQRAEHAIQVRADDRLALADARPVDVRGVAAEQQDAVAAELGEARHVGGRAADRRLVELVVAREQHGAERRRQRDAGGVGDRVREVDALDLERAGVHRVPDRQHLELDVAQLVLVELRARHGDRQLAAVDDRHLVLAEVADHPRQRADVILVAVGDDERLDRVDVLAQVREVRQDEVDAHHLGGREAQAAVDDDDPAVVLDDREVLADLADASEREDAQCAAQRAVASASSPCWASALCTCVRSCSSHSTSGRRSVPGSWPSISSAALTGAGLAVTNIAA